jgi:magnesium transporter
VTLEAVLEYLRRLRSRAGGLPHHLDALTVVDREQRYLGVLSLAAVVSEQPARVVRDVMDARTRALPALMPAREVGRIFRDHDLVSAPVVDESGRLIGRITVDDVIDVIHGHTERAMVSHSGLDVETDIFAPVSTSVRLRSGWLGLHLIGVLIAAWVIDLFSATIEQVVALAALLPVVASMGGVAGSQTLALVVRGMALDQVDSANRVQLIGREAAVGSVNGAIWAAAVLAVTALWFGHGTLALVAGGAMIVTMVGAAIAGAFIPLVLARLGTDPALGSGVVVTAIADIVGFTSLLVLAMTFIT